MAPAASYDRIWAPSVDGGKYDPELHVTVRSGRGVWAETTGGRRLLDANSGLWHLSLGYAPPEVVGAATESLERLGGTTLLRRLHADAEPVVEALAGHLAAMDPVFFFATSGSEAVDVALRIAMSAGQPGGRTGVAYLGGAYHGVSLGPLSLNNSPRYRSGAPAVLPSVELPSPAEWARAPADSATRVEAIFRARGDSLAAVVVEPVQCVAGVIEVPREYQFLLAAMAKAHGCLLVVDEVSTGVFRTGGLLAASVQADMVVLAKGLTGGLSPMSVVAVTRPVADRVRSSTAAHRLPGSTQGGDPIGCACAAAVLQHCTTPGFQERMRRTSEVLHRDLQELAREQPAVLDIRGSGHLWGVRIRPDRVGSPSSFVQRFTGYGLEAELLLHPLSVGVIPVVPALNITEPEVHELTSRLGSALSLAR
ncbi:aspartate aminotransferase family protein [Actinoplanes sp. NBRC 101535]|uniref:class-III pyridoxal-phosphate-dependent aminotransferase n=1 Tax=Actinoplanes sp. NBRC 101535 TaxID=3032196 RepID=UPI0024A4D355|nr:aspartate aminotransferase family protein [Actinoplanes sp. NBRC 101535]GLY02151.1 aspartate aminotransferase family protein [Actinoplanes sp. NBRC 101535]